MSQNLNYTGTIAKNVSKHPKTVEVHLSVVKGEWQFGTGKTTKDCYMYKDENQIHTGSIPGPLIIANKGDTIFVKVRNKLGMDTTVHWHGIESNANMDGSNISQDPIKNNEFFTYKFQVNEIGFTWYHSHVNTREQVERGLHGGIYVRDPNEQEVLQSVGVPVEEHVFMLDDVLLDNDGQHQTFNPEDPNEKATQTFNGRIGNHLLVNGKVRPNHKMVAGTAQYWRIVNVANSTFMRLAIDNPNIKVWRISGDSGLIENPIEITVPQKHDLPQFEIINPVYGLNIGFDNTNVSEGIMLTPGERAGLLVYVSNDACYETSYLKWFDAWRGRHIIDVSKSVLPFDDPNDGLIEPKPLLRLNIRKNRHHKKNKCDDDNFYLPKNMTAIESVDVLDREPKTLLFNFGHGPVNPETGAVAFFATTKIKNPSLPPPAAGPIPFAKLTSADAHSVMVGDNVFVRVQNFTRGWHNYHQHGFTFQLVQYELYRPGKPVEVIPAQYLENKDSILVPGRPTEAIGSKTVALLRSSISEVGREGKILAFPQEDDDVPIVQKKVHRNTQGTMDNVNYPQYQTDFRSNGFLAHCHILEHSGAGMMGVIKVYPK